MDEGFSARPMQTCNLEPSSHVLMGPHLLSFCFTNFSGTEKHWTQVTKFQLGQRLALPNANLSGSCKTWSDCQSVPQVFWTSWLPLHEVFRNDLCCRCQLLWLGNSLTWLCSPAAPSAFCWRLWIKQVSFYPEPVFAELCCMHDITYEIKLSVSAFIWSLGYQLQP